MKFTPVVIAVCLLALGCTEEIIKIQKEIVRDTVILEKFVDRYFANTDTVEIPVVVEVPVPTPVRTAGDSVVQIDTVWQEKIVYVPRVDSVFITTTVVEHDTVVVREYTFGDTLYIYPGRGVYSVPDDIKPVVNEFYSYAAEQALEPYGGNIAITIENIDEVLQAYSYQTYGQLNIVVNGNLTADERWLPVHRELARWQLKAQYSQDPDDYMFPFKQAGSIRKSSPKSVKKLFWDELTSAGM